MSPLRVRTRARAAALGGLVTLSDLMPPYIRYSYIHRATAKLLNSPSRALQSETAAADDATGIALRPPPPGPVFAFAIGDFDLGGIGSVIEVLARGFVARGVRVVVIGQGNGPRADRLRRALVDVRCVTTSEEARRALEGVDVLALHSAADVVERAALAAEIPLVTAMHNTEIHFTNRRWQQFGHVLERSAAGIAVSETVRAFHARNVDPRLAERITVVPNGARVPRAADGRHRAVARQRLASVIGAELGEDAVVFACLARYDAQKNVAGTVASFLHALETRAVDAHFVYAGAPSDRAEYARADAVRALSPYRGRVHLLANSDASTLLAASDAFLLNSFFEGWPMAATEAAAAGLPLIVSEVGGGAELVSALPGRSVLIPNPAGDAASISDGSVARARRASRHQHNRDALGEAIVRISALVGRNRSRPVPPAIADGERAMVEGHLAVMRAALDGGAKV